ncbi:MAG: ComEC/Rec2 family competence protein [Verrucomicrobiota bacterium]
MKRPLGPVVLCYVGGLLLGEWLQPGLILLFVTSLLLVVAACLLPQSRGVLLAAAILMSGWTRQAAYHGAVSPWDVRRSFDEEPAIVEVRGRLCGSPRRTRVEGDSPGPGATIVEMDLDEIGREAHWQPARGRVLVRSRGLLGEGFVAGSRCEVSGVLGPPPGPLAPGLFDFRGWLARREVYYQLRCGEADWRLLDSVSRERPWGDRFRDWARGALAKGLPVEDENLHLEWALTLGEREWLTEETAEPFVKAATFHIFAVDGLRMAILFGLFLTALRLGRMPRFLCGLAVLPVIWVYTAVTGWPASAIRAAVMLSVIVAGWALRRPGDLINSLYLSAFLILLWDPQQLFEAGFQLSFVVVCCMVIGMGVFHSLSRAWAAHDPLKPDPARTAWRTGVERLTRHTVDLGLTSLAAWLGSLPLVAEYFHVVSPVSTPANMVAIPLCALVLASNLLSLCFAAWWPAVSILFNHAGWFLMGGIAESSRWFADWPLASFYAASPGVPGMAAYYAVFLAFFSGWIFRPRWGRCRLAVLGLVVFAWMGWRQYHQAAARVTVLPMNGGFAVYSETPGQDWLVDCGNANGARFVLVPFLRAHGVNSLGDLVLTHGDARSVGGFETLADACCIERVWMSRASFRSAVYRSAEERAASVPGRIRRVGRGDFIGPWQVQHPGPGFSRTAMADDGALVLAARCGNCRVILSSDLGTEGQELLLESGLDLSADIVVAGLPDRGEPLGGALLAAIRPKLVIVADSEFPANRRGTTALEERLRRAGCRVLCTRRSGAVTLEFFAHGYNLSAAGLDSRETSGSPWIIPAN